MLAYTEEHSVSPVSAVILFLFFGYHSQIMPHWTAPNSQLMGICFFLSNPNCCNLLTLSVLLLPPYNFRGCFADGTLHLPGLPPTEPTNKIQISLWDIAKSNNFYTAFLGHPSKIMLSSLFAFWKTKMITITYHFPLKISSIPSASSLALCLSHGFTTNS